jgi:hypothetical protein
MGLAPMLHPDGDRVEVPPPTNASNMPVMYAALARDGVDVIALRLTRWPVRLPPSRGSYDR